MQQLQSGTSLQGGKYHIEKVLGQGGFGITYLAKHTMFNKMVAIKEFFPKMYCDRDATTSYVTLGVQSNQDLVERFMTKFLKEARTISQLNHPNIIHIHDIFQENNTAYYVMEYIEGESLAEKVNREGAFSESVAVRYIKQVAEALSYIHSKNLLHLDVKPGNIMVDHADRAILIDFGLSKKYDSYGDQTSTTPVGVSHGYAPMEQYIGNMRCFSPHIDVYSLGATLYKLITGITPPSASEVLNDGLPELHLPVSKNIQDAIRLSMQPNWIDRPKEANDFISILNGTYPPPSKTKHDEATKLILEKPVSSSAPQTVSVKKNSSIRIIIGVIVCCVVVFTVSLMVSKSSDQVNPSLLVDTVAPIEEVIEEVPVRLNNEFTTKNYTRKEGNSSLSIDYPSTGPDILLQNIREWINERLGGTYEQDLQDGGRFFNHYAKDLKHVNQGYGEFRIDKFYKAYENRVIVTYLHEMETYDGGAHGIEGIIGITFRKSDGKIFSNDFIKGSNSFRTQMIQGLQKYFKVSTNAELMEQILLNNVSSPTIDDIPMPYNNPWITRNGITFWYAEYEISSYAAGTPMFTIPVFQMKDYLTATGKTFLE